MRIDASTMAHTLNRMERDDLIQRAFDPLDRRRVLVGRTPQAQSLRPVLVGAALEVNALATAGLDAEQAAA